MTQGRAIDSDSGLHMERASTTSGSSVGPDDDSERSNKKSRKGFVTRNACSKCRQKKSKCDGKRPTCGRCHKSNISCTYEIAHEGITKMQNLQQQLDTMSVDYGDLKGLFHVLQTGTDQEATALLARLRIGQSREELMASVASLQPTLPAAS